MDRRDFLQRSLVMSCIAGTVGNLITYGQTAGPAPFRPKQFELEELTITDLQEGMKSGKFTARSLTESYLRRIEELDRQGPAIRAVIELNPDARAIADACDQERKTKGPRGPLHGIPVLLKDNIDTADKMTTTAGSLALAGSTPPRDSFVAQRLREAGVVILGKTNLSEWANFRSSYSVSGWSGRGGQTRNPYALDRNPCGSSSGSAVAVAANLAAVAVGTETDGSIVCPSSMNSIVGIKPTLGLVSRSGIIPIAHSQDTAGPMARTVKDAALLLNALVGNDPRDSATEEARGKAQTDYTTFLDPDGLRGARLGVARDFFGFDEKIDVLMEAAINGMRRQGATFVDPVKLPEGGKFGDSELEVMLFEIKADLNSYLASLGPNAPVHSLQEIIEYNERNHEKEMPYFGQDLLVKAQSKGPLSSPEYRLALKKNHRLARTEGIDAVMQKHRLDALIAPTGGSPWVTDLINGDHGAGGCSSPAAVAGYPHITVPAGYLHGLPVGLSFFGRAYSEPVLLRLAFAFEQTTRRRKPPQFLPTVVL